jgi:predicted enzyme related to lactoylglutathione lyase
MTEYEAGVPMWVDVSSTDLDKTRAFYEDLFGWHGEVGGPEVGGYTLFMLNGKMAAGAGPIFNPEQPPGWSTYFKTDDAAATVRAVGENGGQVMMPPMEIMEQGTMAVCQDPTGATFGLWQPAAHKGAEVVNEVGAFCWSELYSRDVPAANEFYTKVLGFEIEETQMGKGPYYLLKIGGRAVAGAISMDTVEMAPSVPPHWLVYFTVANTADAMDKAKSLGGSVVAGPMDTPMGPFAVVSDPVGAAFGVVQFTSSGE